MGLERQVRVPSKREESRLSRLGKRRCVVRKWYGDLYGALQGTYFNACGVSSSNPSSEQQKSDGRTMALVL